MWLWVQPDDPVDSGPTYKDAPVQCPATQYKLGRGRAKRRPANSLLVQLNSPAIPGPKEAEAEAGFMSSDG